MMKPSSLIYLRTLYKVDDPLFSPLKNFFLKIPENMLKFGYFQKVGFWGVRGGRDFQPPKMDSQNSHINIYCFLGAKVHKDGFF